MFLNKGYGLVAPILGFFEVLVWLLVIGEIFQDSHSIINYIAYAAGFAAGTAVGMYIERRLAIGTNLIQVITRKPANQLIRVLRKRKIRIASVKGVGNAGVIDILYITTQRSNLQPIFKTIKKYNPTAFITVEGIRVVNALSGESHRVFFCKTNKTK
jgi:uncharacterized protein YebE (UPF0316 family)